MLWHHIQQSCSAPGNAHMFGFVTAATFSSWVQQHSDLTLSIAQRLHVWEACLAARCHGVHHVD